MAGRNAFTLLEIIAVVAIIGIFAVVLLRALLREIDARYVRNERAALKLYSDALQRAILRQGFVPDHTTNSTGWAATVATELGADLRSIAWNSRRQPRVLLIDPGDLFTPSVLSLPYTQTVAGVFRTFPPIAPSTRARFMLASSAGPMPLPLTPGLMSTNDFQTLWNNPPGTLPATNTWTGFPPDDLILERIDLSPRFVMLTLTTDSIIESQKGQYSIGTNSAIYTVDDNPRFFLENTVVRLYHSQDFTNRLDSQHVLIRGASFHYASHVWTSGDNGGPKYGGLDLAAVARQFLTCVPNLNAPTNQQVAVLQAMVTYMRDYVAWHDVAGWAAGPYYNNVLNDQQVMMSQAQNIFRKSINRYPVNGVAPCP